MIVKELFAKLGLEVDEGAFSVGEKAIELLKSGLLAAGAAAAAGALAIASTIKKTADAGAEAYRTAQKVGTSAGAWQELKFASEAAGTSTESLQMGLGFLARNAYDAAHGGAETGYAFQQLGVSVRDANGKIKSSDQILEEIAARFAKMPDGVEKTATAMRLLGRGGKELIPFLNKGRDGIEALREEARKLGVVIDDKTIQSARHFKKAMHEVEAAGQGLAYAIGGPLIEALTPALEAIAEWIKENRELIAQKVHAAIEAVAYAMGLVWKVAKPLLSIMGKIIGSTLAWKLAMVALGTWLTLLASQQLLALINAIKVAVFWFGAVEGASISAGLSALGAWLAAAAPLLAIIALAAAIFLIFEDLYTFLQGGDSLAGQFADALWQKIPQAWDKIIGYLRDKWQQFADWATDKFAFFNRIMGFVANVGAGSFAGGAASPSASASAGGGASVGGMNIGDIIVNTQGSVDGQDVGDGVVNAIDNERDAWLREALAAGVSG